jgi:ribosomal protein L16 Arg81 hydroxylase
MSQTLNFLPANFLVDYWEKRVLFSQTKLLHSLADESPRDFLSRYGEAVRLFAPGKKDERRVIDPIEGIGLLEQGCTLYLVNYQRYDQRCHTLLESLANLVGAQQGRVSLFLSNHRSYMPFHWDCLNNFTFQLAGEKTWLLAPNNHMAFPAVNFAAGRNRSPGDDRVRPERRRVAKRLMQPGSMLYVPRGHWHATRTRGHSASLSVNFEPCLLAEYVAEQLRHALLQSPLYRINLQSHARVEMESAVSGPLKVATALFLNHGNPSGDDFS